MIGRVAASMLALTGAAYAQETPAPAATTASADRLSYDTAYFAQFNPQTALEMVRQVPGFSLNGGDDRRGFSGAVGNLLIDGVRPTSKSQSLEDILARIPVDQVVRIERGRVVARGTAAEVLANITSLDE